MNLLLKSTLACGIAVVCVLSGSLSAATAEVHTVLPDSQPDAAAPVSAEPQVDMSASVEELDLVLTELSKTQTQGEIDEIKQSQRPAVIYISADDQEIAAAYTDGAEKTRLAYDWLYGCNRVQNACVTTQDGRQWG